MRAGKRLTLAELRRIEREGYSLYAEVTCGESRLGVPLTEHQAVAILRENEGRTWLELDHTYGRRVGVATLSVDDRLPAGYIHERPEPGDFEAEQRKAAGAAKTASNDSSRI